MASSSSRLCRGYSELRNSSRVKVFATGVASRSTCSHRRDDQLEFANSCPYKQRVACKADGAPIGQFDEADFQEKVRRGKLQSDHYYWCEGMTDWKPISEYRPPGRMTRIIAELPTRKRASAAASAKVPDTPLKKLKGLLGRITQRREK
jgi:hypothetical protein